MKKYMFAKLNKYIKNKKKQCQASNHQMIDVVNLYP